MISSFKRVNRTLALVATLLYFLSIKTPAAFAQSTQPVYTLHAFVGSDGSGPSSLKAGRYHVLYGTTSRGGTNGTGSLFKVTPNGTFTPIYSFGALNGGTNSDGANPVSLMEDKFGNLWGIAAAGGTGSRGTAFVITSTGFHVVHTFTGLQGDGAAPSALMIAADGTLYGTTQNGGNGNGTLFKITPTGTFSTVYAFTAGHTTQGSVPYLFNEDGAQPLNAPLLQGADGALYGMTSLGGPGGLGTIFRFAGGLVTRLVDGGNGYGTYTSTGIVNGVVQIDTSLSAVPVSMVVGPDGNFYGTIGSHFFTDQRPINKGALVKGGSVFKLTPAGVQTTLYAFPNSILPTDVNNPVPPEGYDPSSLVANANGTFYGATRQGSVDGGGTIFLLSPDANSSTGYSPKTLYRPIADGAGPQNLLLSREGNLYGTGGGGPKGDGALFECAPTPPPFVLHNFTGADGFDPISLLQARDGNLYGLTYGTTANGNGGGSFFTLTTDSTPQNDTLHGLHVFSSNPPDYAYTPNTDLIQASDGLFYGTTVSGYAAGSIYSFTSTGTLKILKNFPGAGAFGTPLSGVTQGPNGLFYGATAGSGGGNGTIYTYDPKNGTTNILHTFDTADPSREGYSPVGNLLLASDGNFYGVNSRGGIDANSGEGTIYRLTPAGGYTVLHRFDPMLELVGPKAGLVEGKDGFLYGTTNGTYYGSPHGVFKLPKNATQQSDLVTLKQFNNQTEGQGISTSLVLAGDGYFYGLVDGDTTDTGAIFKMTPAGDTQIVYRFHQSDGAGVYNSNPGGVFSARLILGTDGNLYGVATGGGATNNGTIFRLATARPPAHYGGPDFDGDGYADLLFQSQSNGSISYETLLGVTPGMGGYLFSSIPSDLQVVGAADLNGDGKPDLIFQSKANGTVSYAIMNGLGAAGQYGYLFPNPLPAGYRVAATPDLNADGNPDILFQNQASGDIAYVYFNGVIPGASGYLFRGIDPNLKLVGTPDLNGDNHPDLLFQNMKTGDVVYALMNGAIPISYGLLFHNVPLEYQIVATPDLNGDGFEDIVFQGQTNGDVSYVLLNNLVTTGSGYLFHGINTDYKIVGVH